MYPDGIVCIFKYLAIPSFRGQGLSCRQTFSLVELGILNTNANLTTYGSKQLHFLTQELSRFTHSPGESPHYFPLGFQWHNNLGSHSLSFHYLPSKSRVLSGILYQQWFPGLCNTAVEALPYLQSFYP